MGKIAVASDHGGVELKQIIVENLRDNGFEVEDLGTDGPESVDYPDFAHEAAIRIGAGLVERAILICGTGIGMSISANRYSNVRAALCNDVYSSKMSRQHNDANVLVMGGRVLGPGLALEIVSTWLETSFEGGRHERRLNKIERNHLNSVVSDVVTGHLKDAAAIEEKDIARIVRETLESIMENENNTAK